MKQITDKPLMLIGNYIKSDIKSTFKCLVDGCGNEWLATPNSILKGCGCPKCADKNLSKEIVNGRLKYRPLVMIGDYVDKDTKTMFKCLVEGCGNERSATPGSILYSGSGCPKCAGTMRLDKEIVNQRLKTRQLIMVGEYKNNKTKTAFKCLVEGCGYEWKSRPNGILNVGTGCPKCIECGFDPSKPGILYYIKINHRIGEFYKIGVTNRSVEKRFLKIELSMMDIIFEKQYENGIDAYTEEQRILKEFSHYRYTGNDILSSGNSEIFIRDIFI